VIKSGKSIGVDLNQPILLQNFLTGKQNDSVICLMAYPNLPSPITGSKNEIIRITKRKLITDNIAVAVLAIIK